MKIEVSDDYGYKGSMEQYLRERPILFNAGSVFACPDSCGRYGCKEPNPHISIRLFDLASISNASNRKAVHVFRQDVKMGFDPLSEEEPWVGRVSMELQKPCHFP